MYRVPINLQYGEKFSLSEMVWGLILDMSSISDGLMMQRILVHLQLILVPLVASVMSITVGGVVCGGRWCG